MIELINIVLDLLDNKKLKIILAISHAFTGALIYGTYVLRIFIK